MLLHAGLISFFVNSKRLHNARTDNLINLFPCVILLVKLLTSFDITNLCSKYNIKINGIYCRDEIPATLQTGWYILNLDRSTGGGTHWCCWYYGATLSFYFDSFGFSPTKDLETKLGNYRMNEKKIQSLNSDSCGWFCLMCIKYCEDRGNTSESFNKLLSLFTNQANSNERILEHFCHK